MSKFKIPKATPPIILVGLTGSAVAVVFHHAINFIHHAIWHPLAHGTSESFILIGFIVLTLVGLANGWLLSHFAPEAAGSGIPQLKTAYRKNRGQISFRIVWVKFIAATLSVGGGLSLGREGPSVQLAGGLASVIGQKLKLSHFRIRTLTACGAAAGLAAAFNAPIAAVAFVLEEIIEDLNSRTIGPILLASFVSIVTLFFLQGTEPAFAIPAVESFNGWVYLAVPLVAAIASLAGVGFQVSTLSWTRKIRERSSLPAWSRPVIGAWINWAIACLVFYWIGRIGVLGLGHEDLTASLAGELSLSKLDRFIDCEMGGYHLSLRMGKLWWYFHPYPFSWGDDWRSVWTGNRSWARSGSGLPKASHHRGNECLSGSRSQGTYYFHSDRI